MSKGRKIGAIKRKAKSKAKQLVKQFNDVGLHENYGENEIRELLTEIGRLNLGYPYQSQFGTEIRYFIGKTTDILFSQGAGRNPTPEKKKQLIQKSLYFIQNYEWGFKYDQTFM